MLRRLIPLLTLLCMLALAGTTNAQQGNTLTIGFPGAPSGSCSTFMLAVNMATGAEYNCLAGTWNLISGGGGAVSSVFTRTGAVTAQSGDYTCAQVTNCPATGGVVGGTFGASPSSGYTFTSTPITTNPFNGNLLVGSILNPTCNGTYSAGAGFALIAGATNSCFGVEWATGGSASSYTAAFGYTTSQTWGSTISAFSATSPAVVQSNNCAGNCIALAYSSNVGAGHLLWAVIRYNVNTAPGPITSVTDTNNDTWVLAGLRSQEASVKGAGDHVVQEVWYAANCAAGANTVTTHNIASSGATYVSIAEFSGVATTNPLVDYNYNADGTGNTATTTMAGATTNPQYTINAVNNVTGAIDFTGRDSGAVFRSAANNLAATGGLLYYKDGVYPGQTALQESVAGQTNYYIWGLPAPTSSTNIVSWHIECESATFPIYVAVPANGCNHIVLPSAYSGAQPSSTQLSGFWARPNATIGSKGNGQVFFVNGNVQIPDNQRSATIAYDTFTTSYSSHINTVADTAINLGSDGLCGGLTPAVANITGYRTNQASTDETYFSNTWAMGFSTPYNVLSNHPILVNAHAVCNQNAGIFAVATSAYGGMLEHYQDLHNITGPQFNCANAGTRFDSFNQITEDAITGSFARTSNASESNAGNCMGHIDNQTLSANGAVFNPTPYFASGSGANFRVTETERVVQPGLLTSNFTSAATTGTSKQTLATYTFAFNTSGNGANIGPFMNNPGAVFRIKAWGITATNSNSKTFELDFGGTAIATITSTVSNGAIACEAEIVVSSVANTQEIEGQCFDGTVTKVTRTAPGATGTSGIVLNAAATTGTASGDFTFKGMTIEEVGGN